MYIKTLSTRTKGQQIIPQICKTVMPSRKQTCFEIPHHDDKLFTDDFCFNKAKVMPHIQNHRPVIKKRVLKIHEQKKSNTSSVKYSTETDPILKYGKTLATITPVQQKKSVRKNSYNLKNKYYTVRQTLVRTSSDIPDYAKNIMKPCKIGAINIGQRPASARKSMTAQNPRPTIGKRKNSGKNEKKNEEEDSFFGGLKVSQNIAPWAQIDDDY